jgi:phage gp16-like protein
MTATATSFIADDRRNMIAKLHIAKKQLGLDEDIYRASLMRITGKSSARDMTPAELQACLKDFSNKGFKAVSKFGKSGLPTTAKINALWLSGWNLGVIHDPSPRAMEAFIQRQTGIAKAEWLINSADAAKVIDGLKAWLMRDAKVDFSKSKLQPDWMGWPQVRVCMAQWQALRALGAVTAGRTWTGNETSADEELFNYARAVSGQMVSQMSSAEWLKVQQALGRKLRTALEGK